MGQAAGYPVNNQLLRQLGSFLRMVTRTRPGPLQRSSCQWRRPERRGCCCRQARLQQGVGRGMAGVGGILAEPWDHAG